MLISQVVVAGVADDGAVLHRVEVAADEDVLHAGGGDEDVAQLGRLVHRHHAQALEHRLERLGRLDLGGDHARAHAGRAHGHAAPAVAVAGHHDRLAGQEHAGGAQDAVERRLPGAVHVVEVPLCLAVVDRVDRVLELAVGGHGAQSLHARGGLLRAADHLRGQLVVVLVHLEDEVGAVVQGERGLEVQGAIDAPVELVDAQPVPRVDRDALGGQRRGYLVVGAERVASRPAHLGAGGDQRPHQDRGLLGDVQTAGDAHALERQLALRLLAQGHEHWHAGLGPFDAQAPRVSQLQVGYFVVHEISFFVAFASSSSSCQALTTGRRQLQAIAT